MNSSVRINVGCGMTPTEGWVNLDNSLSVRLARVPGVSGLLRFLSPERRAFVAFCQSSKVRYADVRRRLPVKTGSAEVIYSSHMLEHLDRQEVARFLSEARRALEAPDGIIRLALPNIRYLVERYLTEGDADAFVRSTLLWRERPRGFAARLRQILIGDREHYWMYDGASLVKLLATHGFESASILAPGDSMIPNPGALNLAERAGETVYVEARRGF